MCGFKIGIAHSIPIPLLMNPNPIPTQIYMIPTPNPIPLHMNPNPESNPDSDSDSSFDSDSGFGIAPGLPATVTSLRNFGNSVYPALPVSFGGDTKSRRSLLSGVYARGSKISHQSALECVTVVDSTTHSKLPDLQSAIMRRKTLPCTCIGRRRRRK